LFRNQYEEEQLQGTDISSTLPDNQNRFLSQNIHAAVIAVFEAGKVRQQPFTCPAVYPR
jgi:hypothetical protein